MKKALNYLTTKPVRFFFLAAIIAFFVLWGVNEYKDPEGFNWHDVIVESHGVFFDLLVFGILLSIYEALREKNEKIERLHEEIDDYRGRKEKEVMYRIVGVIKRLNILGVTNMDLSDCYLQNAHLQGVKLQGANLRNANFDGAKLQEANLSNTLLSGANFNNTILFGTNFSKAFIDDAHFQNATFLGINIDSTIYRALFKEEFRYEIHRGEAKRQLTPAILQLTNLDQACVAKNWFNLLKKWNVVGHEVVMKKYFCVGVGDSHVILNEYPNLPPSLISLME
jgi:hypothetical protein